MGTGAGAGEAGFGSGGELGGAGRDTAWETGRVAGPDANAGAAAIATCAASAASSGSRSGASLANARDRGI